MPEILVRNLDRQLIERLKERADRNGRSLQAEVKTILERSIETPSVAEFRKMALKVQRKLARRRHSDSAALIREDRAR
jgi:plasmid stability protein